MVHSKNIFFTFTLFILLQLAGCGGGSGSDSKPVTTPPVTTVPDPTISLAKIGDCDTNIECSVFNITGSDVTSAFDLDLSNVQTAYIVANGQKTEVSGNTVDVSGMNSKDFEIHVIHDTAGTMEFSVNSFTVSGKSYNYNGASVSVTFTETVVEETGSFVTYLSVMGSETKLSTSTETQQVKKGEFIPVLNVSNLKQYLSKFDEDTKTFEPFLESDVVLVDSVIEEQKVPVGRYLYKITGEIFTAGVTLTVDLTQHFDLRNGQGYASHLGLNWSNLTPEIMSILSDYDESFNNGDYKDITPSDISNTSLAYIAAVDTGDTVSLTDTAVMEYDIISLREGMYYYDIQLTSDTAAHVAVLINDIELYSHDVTANESFKFLLDQDLEPGNTNLKLQFSNVAYQNGKNLTYYISSGLGPKVGDGGSITDRPERTIIITE